MASKGSLTLGGVLATLAAVMGEPAMGFLLFILTLGFYDLQVVIGDEKD
jgi:hypothetical protein